MCLVAISLRAQSHRFVFARHRHLSVLSTSHSTPRARGASHRSTEARQLSTEMSTGIEPVDTSCCQSSTQSFNLSFFHNGFLFCGVLVGM